MTKKKFEIKKQRILPGFEDGRFEPRRLFDLATLDERMRADHRQGDRNDFPGSFVEGMRRDNRVSVKVSGKDLSTLKRSALAQEIPVQTLLANIIHQYATGELREAAPDESAMSELDEKTGLEAAFLKDS